MSGEVATETATSSEQGPRRRTWIYAVIAALVVVVFGYLSLIRNEDSLANRDYYRVLYEAAETFNENLDQLDRRLRDRQSPSAIKSVLPSYTVGNDETCSSNAAESSGDRVDYDYRLKAQKLEIICRPNQANQAVGEAADKDEAETEAESKNETKTKTEKIPARISLDDILPQPKRGFSLYLFADHEGKVITTAGGEKTISIVELANINAAIAEKGRPFKFSLKQQQGADGKPDDPPLPSYGTHVDMQLSYGQFRLFIFPFKLKNEIEKATCSDTNTGGKCTISQLYLVGLLPKEKLTTVGSGHWNISLLLVTLVSLLFLWTLMRVYLLPKSQSITPAYRNFTMLSGYGFYVVVIALVLAFMQKTVLQNSKDATAVGYAESLDAALKDDLLKVFNGLDAYRPFYQEMVQYLEGKDAEKSFPETLTQSLDSIADVARSEQATGLYPKYAWTEDKVYKLELQRQDQHGKPGRSAELVLYEKAKEILKEAHRENKEKSDMLGFMAGNIVIAKDTVGNGDSNSYFSSYLSPEKHSYLPGNMFTVFAFNGDGNTILPSIYYQEKNSAPRTANLSHREYYKRVRDSNGWQLQLCANPNSQNNKRCKYFNNVYIQRVLNINDGSRGTTISAPMFDPDSQLAKISNQAGLAAYIMGADVIMPSLSLAAPAPADFTYMVVDRNNGDVLFHSDESRTLVENLFHSGNKKSSLGQWIKAALDRFPELGNKIIKGNYHGQDGRFVLIPTAVDAWAIVIFYPNDSLDSFMTNQFLFISISFSIALLLITGFVLLCRHFFCTGKLKSALCVPEKINGRRLVLGSSILLGAIYSLYSIGTLFALDTTVPQPDPSTVSALVNVDWSLLAPIIGLSILLIIMLEICVARIRKIKTQDNSQATHKLLKRFFVVFAVLAALALHLCYLHYAAPMALRGLAFHYNQVQCNQLNYERQEDIRLALSRYPNSITQQGRDPLTLLPIAPDLFDRLKGTDKADGERNLCNSQIEPDDYPNPSSLVGATYLWQWLNSYFLQANLPESSHPAYELKPTFWPVASSSMLLIAIMAGWIVFNGRVLWRRFYCSDLFLQHIERLIKLESALPQEQRNEKLVIECNTARLNGIGLSLLLRTASMQDATTEPDMVNNLLPGFARIYQLSPFLKKIGSTNILLPNLKLNVCQNNETATLDVQIWDIETCLENAEYRQYLLDLIMELKSLTLAGQITGFTVFTGFHSLQRVKMKDPLSMEQGSALKHAEYLSWAECLMDFNVKVPAAFKQRLDKQLLSEEVRYFPELRFLATDKRKSDADASPKKDLWKVRKTTGSERQWNTINYILLHAEDIYRFKWESCSNAEKLALFNLAKKRRLNPSNTQMIEHLALNGLIKVTRGHLQLINHSIAHFILNAETADTLNRMVRRSQEGIWKSYRLPLGFLVVLIIGGIALTSGESLYIIAASVAGVLTTIAGVANSAHLLRGQIKE